MLCMNIAFAINQSYVTHCAATIQSILFNHPETELNFYILIDQVSPSRKNKLVQAFQSCLVNINIIQVAPESFATISPRDHLVKAGFYRLLIPDLVPASRVLYLDADTIVNGSILEFYGTDLDGFVLAAIENNPSSYLGRKKQSSPHYFGSGVLLFNLNECRRIDLTKLARDYLKKHPVSDDEPLLNGIVGKSWKVMPPKYNFASSYVRFARQHGASIPAELQESFAHPIIIHYTGPYKPWFFWSRHPYRHLYWQYLKMTPFYHPLNPDIIADNLRLSRYLIHRKLQSIKRR